MAISKITNDGIGDIDELTVDTNTLVVDSTNNRVGIGTNSPDTPLHVHGGSIGSGTGEVAIKMSLVANTISAHNEIRSGNIAGTSPYMSFAVREESSPYATVERMRINGSGSIITRPAGTSQYMSTVYERSFGTQSTGSYVDIARIDARFPYEVTFINVGGNTAPRSWCIHISKDWTNPGTISVDIQSRLNSGQVIFDAVRMRGWQGGSLGSGPVVLQARTDTLYSSGSTYYFTVRPLSIGDIFMDDLATLNADTASNGVTNTVSLNQEK